MKLRRIAIFFAHYRVARRYCNPFRAIWIAQAFVRALDGPQPDGDPHGECAAEIHRLRDALAGLVGLVQLVAARDDIPAEARESLLCSHRLDAALDALAQAEGVTRHDVLQTAREAIAQAAGGVKGLE